MSSFESLREYADLALMWVGFGTVVGLLAKAVMPGRDPGGAVATLAMGIGGTIIGCGVMAFLRVGIEFENYSPTNPRGFLAGIAGAFLILFFYRLLGGYWFIEGEHPSRRHRLGYRYRRRRRRATYAHMWDDD